METRVLPAVVLVALIATVSHAGVVVDDDFSGTTLDTKVWNHGGGFSHNTANENALLSTFGGNWGSKGDGSGAAGLNSNVGSASFTVKADGTHPIGGNFSVGKGTYEKIANALVRIDLSTKGAGAYEIVWNNSGTSQDFKTASGWSGTIAGNSYVWIVDDDREGAVWGKTDSAENVTEGDAADRFGFWSANKTSTAVIDDVKVYDTTTAP